MSPPVVLVNGLLAGQRWGRLWMSPRAKRFSQVFTRNPQAQSSKAKLRGICEAWMLTDYALHLHGFAM